MTKIEQSIARIQDARKYADMYGRRLILAYSGGKDSDILLDLAIKSGVIFEVKHNHTTVDAPETVYYIREVFARLNAMGIMARVELPPVMMIDGKMQRVSMWNLIPHKKMPPTRIARYCCQYLKERSTDKDVHLLLGVRWAESVQRKTRGVMENIASSKSAKNRIVYFDENDDARKLTEICALKATVTTNPIIDWSDDSVWNYIRQNKLKINPLYTKGFTRVGCVGCPMNTKVKADLEIHFPRYKRLYMRALERLIESRKRAGLPNHNQTAETLYRWWMDKNYNPNQMEIDFDEINKEGSDGAT